MKKSIILTEEQFEQPAGTTINKDGEEFTKVESIMDPKFSTGVYQLVVGYKMAIQRKLNLREKELLFKLQGIINIILSKEIKHVNITAFSNKTKPKVNVLMFSGYCHLLEAVKITKRRYLNSQEICILEHLLQGLELVNAGKKSDLFIYNIY